MGVIASIVVAVVAAASVTWIIRSAAESAAVSVATEGAIAGGPTNVLASSRSTALAATAASAVTVTVPSLPQAPGVTPSTPGAHPSSGTRSTGGSGAGSVGSTSPDHAAQQASTATSAATKAATSKTARPATTAVLTTTTLTTPTPGHPTPTSATPPPGTTTSRSSYPDAITPDPKSADETRDAVRDAVEEAAEDGITQSVVILDRRTGKTLVSVNGDAQVPSVSIAKLIFAADWLDSDGGGAGMSADELADFDDMISTSNDDIASDYYGYHGEGDLVTRVAQRYGLDGTEPATNPRYWGDIDTTAGDVASLLEQVLANPKDGPYLSAAMRDATRYGADGFNQEFGMNAVVGAGSKQGWGCCLGGVVAIHSAGFTADRIVVILSTSYPDATGINVPQVSAYQNDPGFLAAVAASTATAKAAVDPDG